MTGKPPQKPVAHVHPVVDAVVPVHPVADALDEDTICRKSGTIVDELAQNKDFKVRVGLCSGPWWTTGGAHPMSCIVVVAMVAVVAVVAMVACGVESTEGKAWYFYHVHGSDLTCMVNVGNRVCEGDAQFAIRLGQ